MTRHPRRNRHRIRTRNPRRSNLPLDLLGAGNKVLTVEDNIDSMVLSPSALNGFYPAEDYNTTIPAFPRINVRDVSFLKTVKQSIFIPSQSTNEDRSNIVGQTR